MRKAYLWVKKKILWFFLGGVALAAGVAVFPEGDPCANLSQVPGSYAGMSGDMVTQVIGISPKTLCERGMGPEWKEVRNDPASTKDDADVGDTYNTNLRAFIRPKPSADATLDTKTAEWVVPEKTKTQAELNFFAASSTDL